jgi:hypothetical protein
MHLLVAWNHRRNWKDPPSFLESVDVIAAGTIRVRGSTEMMMMAIWFKIVINGRLSSLSSPSSSLGIIVIRLKP